MSKYEYKSITRSEVSRHFKLLGFSGEFIEEFIPLLKNPRINVIRIRGGKPSGADGFITNDIHFCIDKHAKALCEWLYLTDSETKIRNHE
jgi:hypothetical protein